MWYIKEDWRGSDYLASIGSMFIRPWLAMLALGGLGHQLHQPALYQSYWAFWLAVLAARMFFGQSFAKSFKAAQTREELK